MLGTFDKFHGDMLKALQRRSSTTASVIVTAALLSPAVYNGFPILFPDTSAYLRVAFDRAWTLDRSGFYGLALKPVSLIDATTGLWIVAAIQCFIVAAILTAVSLRLVRSYRNVVCSLGAVCLFTSLPWHAAQLMPDAFTGSLILLAWMLASSDVKEPGTPLLWLGAAALTLFHYTHLVIFPVAMIAALIVQGVGGRGFTGIGRNVLTLAVCCSAVVSAHVTANGLMFGRWTVAPMGSYFLFARVHEDGLVSDWMARHCGKDASPELCSLAGKMPRDSQVLLWGGDRSPFNSRINHRPGAPESWPWIDRLSQAAVGSIREEPARFAVNLVKAGARQFISFRTLDDECPSECRFRGLTRAKPALGARIANSRQVRDSLPKPLIQAIDEIVAAAGLLLVLPVLAIAIRRKDVDVASLLTAILAGICANAVVTGGLSDIHDRYQSRVIWLVPFAVILALVRWVEDERTARNLLITDTDRKIAAVP